MLLYLDSGSYAGLSTADKAQRRAARKMERALKKKREEEMKQDLEVMCTVVLEVLLNGNSYWTAKGEVLKEK